jgi:hypothetical protein
MKQPAKETGQGSFGLGLATQLQLAFEICIEQSLQHSI